MQLRVHLGAITHGLANLVLDDFTKAAAEAVNGDLDRAFVQAEPGGGLGLGNVLGVAGQPGLERFEMVGLSGGLRVPEPAQRGRGPAASAPICGRTRGRDSAHWGRPIAGRARCRSPARLTPGVGRRRVSADGHARACRPGNVSPRRAERNGTGPAAGRRVSMPCRASRRAKNSCVRSRAASSSGALRRMKAKTGA